MSTPSTRRLALSVACLLALAAQAAVAAPPAVSGKPGPQANGGYLHADGFLSKGDMLVDVGVPSEARQAPAQFAGEASQGQEPSATQTR